MRISDWSSDVCSSDLALQVEQRWKFAERWGVVGFAGVGGVGSDIGEVFEADVLASGGLGLRFQASKDYEVHLAVDGAVNRDGDLSLYFRIGEAFCSTGGGCPTCRPFSGSSRPPLPSCSAQRRSEERR